MASNDHTVRGLSRFFQVMAEPMLEIECTLTGVPVAILRNIRKYPQGNTMSNTLRDDIVIRKCDNLTKENFWDIVEKHCPITFSEFKQYIDRYKETVNWNTLFNYGAPHYSQNFPTGYHNPKFHDLPIEMQMGVIFNFFDKRDNVYGLASLKTFDMHVWVDAVCEAFYFSEIRYPKTGL